MKLKQQLGEDFTSKLTIIEKEAGTLWKKGELYHVYYTLHGLDHSNSVIAILEELVDGLNPEDGLNKTEIFCLLSAALLHDVGMVLKYPNDEERAARKSELKKRPYSIQDLIRDEHHIRSGRYITEHSTELKLGPGEADCIKLIVEGHRQINLESDEYDDRPIGLTPVRVRVLSALLRLADELDLLPERAPETLRDILENNMPDSSRIHWLKHYYTSGLLITTSETAKGKKRTSIEIHCRYPTEEVGRKITEVLIADPIENTLNEVRMILLDCGLRLTFDYKIEINSALDKLPEDLYDKYLGQKLKISMELPRTKGFVGRKAKLDDLLSSLDRNVIIIEGIAGIGKSYIAAKFAEDLKDEYTVYWYGNLSEVSTLSSVLKKISIFLKENGRSKLSNSIEHFGYDNEVLIALLKEELNSNKFAIFFDDYHNAEKGLNPLLRQLVNANPSKIIVITREDPDFYNVVDEQENRVIKIKIDPWDCPNTKLMLEARGIEATDEIIQEIHERLLGHPQYLNLFCIMAERSTAEQLLEDLPIARKEAHEYLEQEVYNSLTSNEKLLLQTIAIFRIPETVDALDRVNKFEDLNETLNRLIHKFLVNEVGLETYNVHDIIRDYCLGDVRRRKTLRDYHEKAAQYYLSLDNDPEHILEASYHFDEAGMKEESADVIITNATNLIAKGFWEKIGAKLQDAIEYFKRKKQPQYINLIAKANYEIASLYEAKGELDLALNHTIKCLNLFRKVKDITAIFEAHNSLANIYYYKNEIPEAKKHHQKCYDLAKSQNDDSMQAVAMATYGTIMRTEDIEQSLDYHQKSLKFFEDENDEKNIASACNIIAIDYGYLGNYKKSYEFNKRALEIFKGRMEIFEISRTKLQRAELYFRDQERPVSINSIIKCLEEILETYEKMGHVRGEADVYTLIGDIYRKEKDSDSAIVNYQNASKLYAAINEEFEEAVLFSKIGYCYFNLDDFNKSKSCYDKARSYFEKKLHVGRCSVIDKLSLAEIYLIYGDYSHAYDLSNELVNDKECSELRPYVSHVFLSIASVLLNKLDDAYIYLKELGNYCGKGKTNWDFSDIEPVLDKTGEFKELFFCILSQMNGYFKYPIVLLKDIKVISEVRREEAEIFHPFTGSLIITKDDEDLGKIMKKLSHGIKVDFDVPEIMGIPRNKALYILGFLFKKGFLDCENLENQRFDLKLTERGLRVWEMRGSS